MRRSPWFVLIVASGCGLDLVGVASTPPAPDDASVRDAQTDSLIVDSGIKDAPIEAAPGASCSACPTGTAQRLCVAGACADTRRVFITHDGFAANFGGATQADKLCQDRANAANLHGTWMAWLGSSTGSGSTLVTTSPPDRFTKSEVPYRLLDGTQIAASWVAMVPPSGGSVRIDHLIDLDENMKAANTQHEVWTGLDIYGYVAVGATCRGWTSKANGDLAEVGLNILDATYDQPYDWTDAYRQTCDRDGQHLYCFEQ